MNTHYSTNPPDQKPDDPPAEVAAPAPDIAAVVDGAARELHDSAWDYDGPTMDKGKGVKEIAAILTRHLAPLVERLERAERENLEQARLLGMSGEREAALLAKLEGAEKERDEARHRLVGHTAQLASEVDNRVKLEARLATLEAERENWRLSSVCRELAQDRERLDRLAVLFEDRDDWDVFCAHSHEGMDLRAAIDRAMQEKNEK